MRKTIMALMLTTVLSVCAVSVAAEMAKEGTGSARSYYTGTFQMLPIGKVRVQMNYEGFGISVSDTGQGLFHNASQHVLGGLQIVKGAIEDSGCLFRSIALPHSDRFRHPVPIQSATRFRSIPPPLRSNNMATLDN